MCQRIHVPKHVIPYSVHWGIHFIRSHPIDQCIQADLDETNAKKGETRINFGRGNSRVQYFNCCYDSSQ